MCFEGNTIVNCRCFEGNRFEIEGVLKGLPSKFLAVSADTASFRLRRYSLDCWLLLLLPGCDDWGVLEGVSSEKLSVSPAPDSWDSLSSPEVAPPPSRRCLLVICLVKLLYLLNNLPLGCGVLGLCAPGTRTP